MSSVPLCRCRVLYIGSAVPTITKDGLQGIQQPLRERYPVKENAETKGIDSWLSVWSNGLLLEYIDGSKKTESAFFQITTLHYCAAVRYVNVSGFAVSGGGERFIPLDTPFANIPESPHPPIFAAMFRRTTGVKVLECHAFICTNERAANALVRCCFHSYADTMYIKIDEKMPMKAIKEASRSGTPSSEQNTSEQENGGAHDVVRDEAEWNERAIGQKTWQRRQQSGEYDSASISSSLFNKQKKRHRKGDSRSDVVDERLIVPYVENTYGRRAGSQSDLRGSDYPGSAFGGTPMPPYGHPPPHMMGRPPFHPLPPGMLPPPPPHMFRPPPGFLPFPPPPPHFFPPPPPGFGGRMMPPPFPPFMPPPRGMFMPPPFGHMPPHGFPHPMERPKTPTATGGPIIETIYDTFPRRGTYEEPIYTSSNNGAPTQSSYKPGSVAPEYYEGYYETYRRHRTPEKKNGSRSESDISADESSQLWNEYEGGLYRKAHLNEKAFGSALARSNGHGDKVNGDADHAQPSTSKASHSALDSSTPVSTKRDAIRPPTPPADYDQDPSKDHTFGHTKRTAVF